MRFQIVCAALCVSLIACKGKSEEAKKDDKTEANQKKPEPVEQPEVKKESEDWYRVTLEFQEDHRLAFLMKIPPAGSAEKAMIVNGEEEITVDHSWNGDELAVELKVDPYPSKITAKRSDEKTLAGEWFRTNPFFGDLNIPTKLELIGKKDPKVRYPASEPPKGDFSGTWKFELEHRGTAVAQLEQTPDGVVTGYVRPHHFGDSQHLAGNVRGDKLFLSTFDGRSGATTIMATIDEDGFIEGELRLADSFFEGIEGERVDDNFAVESDLTLKGGLKKFPLAELDKPPYAGKPTVVFLFATWCPICSEVNQELLALYEEYHAKGVEVYGIAIDLSADEAANQKALDEYREKSKIPWQLKQQPGTPQTFAQVPPLDKIEGFQALPVTVYLNADHSIHKMVAGFDGSSTGKRNRRAKDDLRKAIAAIAGTAK
jgi:thiol-disulfide isomerase/thioredoxin